MIEVASWFLLGVILREVAIHIIEFSERKRNRPDDKPEEV